MLTLAMNICPQCGQIIFGLRNALRANCPACNMAWRIFPDDRIEVRISA